jgi:hypothetical protein
MGKERQRMSKEQVLRWMLEFGTDDVSTALLHASWADKELHWASLDKHGWLEYSYNAPPYQVRLTEKAIKSLEE